MTTNKDKLKKKSALTTLNKIDIGKKFIISEIKADYISEQSLLNLGISKGIKLEIIRKSPLKGPIVVKAEGSEIAIGYNLAEKIYGCLERTK